MNAQDIMNFHKLLTLRRADLRRANLQGADLRGADLQEADLQGAFLQGADLRRADLRRADLQGAFLQGADLRRADLRRADLQEADLRGADLRGVDLRGADGIISIYIPKMSSRDDYLYLVKHDDGWMVKAGCFWGTMWEFEERLNNSDHGIYWEVTTFIKRLESEGLI